jgi:serine/threonine protein phosphatase PrpC
MLRAYGITDRGRIRATNEDCYGIDHELRLCVIADGMGGHRAGEVAARMAVDAVMEYVSRSAVTTTWPFGFDPSISEAGNLLKTAIHVANARIFEAASATPDYFGMGTTAVAILERDGVISVAHVGDSRLYVFAKQRLRQMTDDDSWAASVLARDPQLDTEALQKHPMRNALTNVVGSRPKTTVHLSEHALDGGELLVLTTDGVHGVLDESSLAQVMEQGDTKRIASGLIDAALANGSRDNCTAVVAEYVQT